ncbi:MAG TPA: hypothetical protein VGD88_00350 [Opitutaceae bacterium]
MLPSRVSIATILLAAGLFLSVVGLKLVVIDRYGSDLPEWDQWDAEGLHILLPWQRGTLGIGDFFRAHNEHRIVLTKVLGLAGVALNGQWDSRLQCVINAGIHALLAVGFFIGGRRMLPGRWHAPWFVLLTACFGLPLAWQNVIAGFHSQQYFLLGFSALAIWYLPFHPPLSGRWWLGLVSAVLVFFSMGSGFLTAAVILAVLMLELLYRHRTLREVGLTIVLTGLITAAGWFGRVTVDYHASLQAKSVGDFLAYAVHNFRWPASTSDWPALLFWLPWLVIVGRYLARVPGSAATAPMRLAGLGGWVFLQIIASAYARGAGGGDPASRYMDTLALGLVINGLALAWLLSALRPAPIVRWIGATAAVAWGALAGHGLYHLTKANVINDLSGWVDAYHDEGESRTRAYLATGRRSHLESDQIPYPGAGAYSERLAHEELQRLLPASVRLPITLVEASNTGFISTDFSKQYRPPAPSGLASETPEPLHGTVRGSQGDGRTARWESRTVRPSRHAWLVFQLAGAASSPSTSLRLLDATTRETLAIAEVDGGLVPGAWRNAYVATPAKPFIVLVEDATADDWIAFREPVEMAGLSRLAARLTARGENLVFLGGLLTLAGLIASWSAERRAAASGRADSR